MRLIDLTGETFGRLTVIRRDGTHFRPNGTSVPTWLCRCECGKTTVVQGSLLRSGNTKSCGCYSRDATIARSTKHGAARRGATTREHRIWAAMRNRCGNPNRPDFRYYGGRGIAVCDAWMDSFENFLRDMGPCPEGFTLDRIDVDGPYAPENCRWASRKEQRINQRSRVRWLNVNGERMCLTDAAAAVGLARETLKDRLDSGWDTDRALRTPCAA